MTVPSSTPTPGIYIGSEAGFESFFEGRFGGDTTFRVPIEVVDAAGQTKYTTIFFRGTRKALEAFEGLKDSQTNHNPLKHAVLQLASAAIRSQGLLKNAPSNHSLLEPITFTATDLTNLDAFVATQEQLLEKSSNRFDPAVMRAVMQDLSTNASHVSKQTYEEKSLYQRDDKGDYIKNSEGERVLVPHFSTRPINPIEQEEYKIKNFVYDRAFTNAMKKTQSVWGHNAEKLRSAVLEELHSYTALDHHTTAALDAHDKAHRTFYSKHTLKDAPPDCDPKKIPDPITLTNRGSVVDRVNKNWERLTQARTDLDHTLNKNEKQTDNLLLLAQQYHEHALGCKKLAKAAAAPPPAGGAAASAPSRLEHYYNEQANEADMLTLALQTEAGQQLKALADQAKAKAIATGELAPPSTLEQALLNAEALLDNNFFGIPDLTQSDLVIDIGKIANYDPASGSSLPQLSPSGTYDPAALKQKVDTYKTKLEQTLKALKNQSNILSPQEKEKMDAIEEKLKEMTPASVYLEAIAGYAAASIDQGSHIARFQARYGSAIAGISAFPSPSPLNRNAIEELPDKTEAERARKAALLVKCDLAANPNAMPALPHPDLSDAPEKRDLQLRDQVAHLRAVRLQNPQTTELSNARDTVTNDLLREAGVAIPSNDLPFSGLDDEDLQNELSGTTDSGSVEGLVRTAAPRPSKQLAANLLAMAAEYEEVGNVSLNIPDALRTAATACLDAVEAKLADAALESITTPNANPRLPYAAPQGYREVMANVRTIATDLVSGQPKLPRHLLEGTLGQLLNLRPFCDKDELLDVNAKITFIQNKLQPGVTLQKTTLPFPTLPTTPTADTLTQSFAQARPKTGDGDPERLALANRQKEILDAFDGLISAAPPPANLADLRRQRADLQTQYETDLGALRSPPTDPSTWERVRKEAISFRPEMDNMERARFTALQEEFNQKIAAAQQPPAAAAQQQQQQQQQQPAAQQQTPLSSNASSSWSSPGQLPSSIITSSASSFPSDTDETTETSGTPAAAASAPSAVAAPLLPPSTLQLVDTTGEGDCLFYALVQSSGEKSAASQEEATQMRTDVVTTLRGDAQLLENALPGFQVNYDDATERLRGELASLDFILAGQQGIQDTQNQADALRTQIADRERIVNDSAAFKEAYLQEMARAGTFGAEAEVLAASKFLDRRICIAYTNANGTPGRTVVRDHQSNPPENPAPEWEQERQSNALWLHCDQQKLHYSAYIPISGGGGAATQ